MTETRVSAVPRGILQSRDVNQEQSGSTQEMRRVTPIKPPATKNVATPPSPADSETKEELGTPGERFEQVCKFRVSEDPSGELAEFGIEEWSINDFECLEKLGSGTAGTVFRARERVSGYEVALKVQEYDPQDITADVELDIHCGLGVHPNVLRMIDYFYSDLPFGDLQELEQDEEAEDGEIKEYLYMILELCEMGSLFDVIESNEGGWLDECEAAQYLQGCLRGLKFLHEKDMIHGDIKTANFLVDQNDVVKLADFGMTVRFDEREVLGGSPVFMAPEHLQAWRAGGHDFDHRVDIYGLGVTLFQILVGDFPFYVIESDQDNKNADSLLACYGKLTLGDGPEGFDPKRLDLRVLDDKSSTEPFTMPEISFPDRISEEAVDLISRLMEPNANKRITIDDALAHVWFRCHA
jgi:serine/threonine protein kinase